MTTHIYAPEGSGPCAKQTVKATIIVANGDRYVGTNHCMAPQTTCARAGMDSGVGYELCKSICQQDAHAEVNAIRFAGDAAKGATLFLEGHTYACASCMDAAEAAGVAKVIIGAPPEKDFGTAELVVRISNLIRRIEEETAQGFKTKKSVEMAWELNTLADRLTFEATLEAGYEQ